MAESAKKQVEEAKKEAASRFSRGLAKVKEEAADKAAKLKSQVRELREGGRFGRATVDGVEAFVGGGLGGALDAFGVAIPIGETKKYAYFEVATDESGKMTGFVDKDGDNVPSIGDAANGVEEVGASIPAALPIGLAFVAGGAMYEQADAVEVGKGMLGYAGGRLANDAVKMVRGIF